jgi:hypothetical protein
VVEHVPEHGVTYGSEPVGEKLGEGETAAERQPPRVSGCEAATSSWGWRLGVAETRTRRAKACFIACQMSKWFYGTSLSTATRAAHEDSLIGGTKSLDAQARWTWWFGPLERNILCLGENESCIVVCVVQLYS